MTRKEVIVKAIEGRLTWIAAADILNVTPRHMRRLRALYEQCGYDGLVDQRGGTPRRKRERYADFSIQHFWEQATERHGLQLSYTWTRVVAGRRART